MKSVNLSKERIEKLRLKRQGHSLIDKIKWKGYSKDFIYITLAKKLGVHGHQGHFASMHTIRELSRAVDVLILLENKLPITPYVSKGIIKPKTSVKIKAENVVVPILITQTKKEKRKQTKKQNVLPRDDMIKALEELKQAKSYPHSTVGLIENSSYNIHMSINRDAVKEIYSHDGKEAAIKYLVDSEHASLNEAQQLLPIIIGGNNPSFLNFDADPPATFYCMRDNELIGETPDKTAVCPVCGVDISQQHFDSSDSVQPNEYMFKIKAFFNKINPFK